MTTCGEQELENKIKMADMYASTVYIRMYICPYLLQGTQKSVLTVRIIRGTYVHTIKVGLLYAHEVYTGTE